MKAIQPAAATERRRHEAIAPREPFSWLGVDGQPVPLESDEQAGLIKRTAAALRAAYAMTSGLGAAAGAGVGSASTNSESLVASGGPGRDAGCVGSQPLAAQLFDPARPPTTLFAAFRLHGRCRRNRARSEQEVHGAPDLTKRKSGRAGQARVEEFKRKEREAKLGPTRRPGKLPKPTTRQTAEEEDKKDSSSDDEQEQEGRRRQNGEGRGLGRADAARRWRDLNEGRPARQRAQRHQPKREGTAKEPRQKRRRRPRKVRMMTMLCRSQRMIKADFGRMCRYLRGKTCRTVRRRSVVPARTRVAAEGKTG